jgi:hypothetical protein
MVSPLSLALSPGLIDAGFDLTVPSLKVKIKTVALVALAASSIQLSGIAASALIFGSVCTFMPAVLLQHLGLQATADFWKLVTDLTQWVNHPTFSENKKEAAKRIVYAYLTSSKELNLNSLRLQSLPDCISKLTQLKSLWLNNNQLTALPDTFGQLTQLKDLWLDNSQLTALPDTFGQLTQLIILALRNNQLTMLPQSFSNLSSNLMTDFDNNRFTPGTIQVLLTGIATVRQPNPSQGPHIEFTIFDHNRDSTKLPLNKIIPFWIELYNALPGVQVADANRYVTFCESLPDNEKNNLTEYLNRVRDTEDFKNGTASEKYMATLEIYEMIRDLQTNEHFRIEVFKLLEDALSSCRDRVTIARNNIEIQRLLSENNVDSIRFSQILIGVERKALIEKAAYKRIREKGLGDRIETLLYYHIKSKDALKLPISINNMSYEFACGVTAAEVEVDSRAVLEQTKTQEQIISLLLQYQHWSNKIKEIYRSEFDHLVESSSNDMKSGSTSSEATQNASNAKQQFEVKEKALIVNLTNQWVSDNWNELKSWIG